MTTMKMPTSYARKLLVTAAAAGCDERALLEETGLSRRMIEEESELSAVKYAELYQRVMIATQDEWFGMFSGGKVPLGTFRMVCLTLIQCKNLQQAIIRAGEFAEICRGPLARFYLSVTDTLATLTLAPHRSVDEHAFRKLLANARPDAMVTTLVAWHRVLQWLTAKELPLVELQVTFAESEMAQPFVHTHAEKIVFGREHNAIIYRANCLSFPVVQDQESLMAFLRTAPYPLVTEDPKNISLTDRVRNILKKDVSGTMPGAEMVASLLNMSTTTLRRQLQQEETSYQKLKDECRMEAAFHYLSCPELSNNDIAEKLGFDEPSAFFRSFKKWTGKTPGEYRSGLIQM